MTQFSAAHTDSAYVQGGSHNLCGNDQKYYSCHFTGSTIRVAMDVEEVMFRRCWFIDCDVIAPRAAIDECFFDKGHTELFDPSDLSAGIKTLDADAKAGQSPAA